MHPALSESILKSLRRSSKPDRRFCLLSCHVVATKLSLIETVLQYEISTAIDNRNNYWPAVTIGFIFSGLGHLPCLVKRYRRAQRAQWRAPHATTETDHNSNGPSQQSTRRCRPARTTGRRGVYRARAAINSDLLPSCLCLILIRGIGRRRPYRDTPRGSASQQGRRFEAGLCVKLYDSGGWPLPMSCHPVARCRTAEEGRNVSAVQRTADVSSFFDAAERAGISRKIQILNFHRATGGRTGRRWRTNCTDQRRATLVRWSSPREPITSRSGVIGPNFSPASSGASTEKFSRLRQPLSSSSPH